MTGVLSMASSPLALSSVVKFFDRFPVSSSIPGAGVVCAVDSAYFPGLQLLVLSLRKAVDVAVFDLGLDPIQRAWLVEWGVTVLPVLEPALIVPRGVSMWQTWNKPLFLQWSPFRYSLWVDADCLVFGDLKPWFERSRAGPVACYHPQDGLPYALNPDALYRLLPVPKIFAPDGVQAGLVAVGQDDETGLLEQWGFCVARVWSKDFPMTTACWDQGALLWAFERLKLRRFLIRQPGWGRFVRLDPGRCERSLLVMLRSFEVRSDDVVLHFIGRQKYWAGWGCFLSW